MTARHSRGEYNSSRVTTSLRVSHRIREDTSRLIWTWTRTLPESTAVVCLCGCQSSVHRDEIVSTESLILLETQYLPD